MFARVFALLPLVGFVAAYSGDGYEYQCNTGSAYCCNQSGYSTSPDIVSYLESIGEGGLIGSLGIGANVLLGIQCAGIIGTGSSCDEEPICCEDNTQVGVVNVGCSPISILS